MMEMPGALPSHRPLRSDDHLEAPGSDSDAALGLSGMEFWLHFEMGHMKDTYIYICIHTYIYIYMYIYIYLHTSPERQPM